MQGGSKKVGHFLKSDAFYECLRGEGFRRTRMEFRLVQANENLCLILLLHLKCHLIPFDPRFSREEEPAKNTNGNKSFEFVPILPRQASLTWCQATVIVAGHPAFPLLALWSCSRPLPSVATFYSGNFRFSFRHPCGSLPGASGFSPSSCLPLR